MRAESAGSKRVQVRDRLGVDRDADADSAKAFAIAEIRRRKIDIPFSDAARLILPA